MSVKVGRRWFLKGIGGAMIGLPALGIFAKDAKAQTVDPIRRAMFMWTPNGFNLSTFYPRARFGGGSSAFGALNADSFAARPLDTTSNDTVDGVQRRLFRHPEWGIRNLQPFASRSRSSAACATRAKASSISPTVVITG